MFTAVVNKWCLDFKAFKKTKIILAKLLGCNVVIEVPVADVFLGAENVCQSVSQMR
jgi:hypothetical protein